MNLVLACSFMTSFTGIYHLFINRFNDLYLREGKGYTEGKTKGRWIWYRNVSDPW